MISVRHVNYVAILGVAVATVGALSDFALAAGPSFQDATRAPYSPPPEKSINGRKLDAMKAAVEKSWSEILFDKNGKKVSYVVTLATDAGDIKIKFWPEVAPNHARSFIALCKAGFYDGLIFHRCIPGFVIQGGCPRGDGTAGPGYCLKPEFNPRPHTRGVLSMARAQPLDSGGSQFFLCVDDANFLDRKYTGFGYVVSGMDVVDKIVAAPRDQNDRPRKPVKIKQATVAIEGT